MADSSEEVADNVLFDNTWLSETSTTPSVVICDVLFEDALLNNKALLDNTRAPASKIVPTTLTTA